MKVDPIALLSRKGEALSHGLSGGLSAGRVVFAGNRAGFPAAGFPTVKYLRIFFEALWPKPANGQQIVDALERPVRFAHLQNLFRRRRPDAGNLLQFV